MELPSLYQTCGNAFVYPVTGTVERGIGVACESVDTEE